MYKTPVKTVKKQTTAVMQMFYGENGNPSSIKFEPREIPLDTEVNNNYNLLCEKLKPDAETLELFLKYINGLERLNIFKQDVHYAEGFKFGLLIGIEAGESKFGG
ncbi:MAG: hypothetical protein K2L72_05800 [Clostridia bacterium]|nr:hypothetical protein [Clostridia bacterium]